MLKVRSWIDRRMLASPGVDNDILILRVGELALVGLVELAKQGPHVGGIARGGGRIDTVQSGDDGGAWVCSTLVKRYRR